RELVVGTALEYLDRLSRQSSGDLALDRELAAAYAKVGDVQGSPSLPNLGRADDALASYARSEALWERVAKARPRDVAALRSLAAVRLVEGDIYRGKRDRPATQRFYQRGADAANQAAAAAPSDAEVLYVAGSA